MKIERLVSVVAPIYNDADIVESFIADTVGVLDARFSNFELVMVDDGSDDGTPERILDALDLYEGVRLIRLSRRFGEEVAISAGLESVIGDYIVVMLPYMDPPEMIPEMVIKSMDGVDVVYGIRKTPRTSSWVYRASAGLFYWYCWRFLGLDMPENSAQFRCLSRQAVNAIIRIKDPSRYLRLFSAWVGFRRESIDYEPFWRGGRERRRSFFSAVNMAIGIIVENSPHPLRLISWAGMFAAVGNLLYILYIVMIYLFKEDVMEGWTTLSMQNAGQFFFITLILTALSEYVGRIMNRLRDRPLYFVMGEYDSRRLLIGEDERNVVDDAEGDSGTPLGDPTRDRAS